MDLPVPDDIHMEMPTLHIYPKSINIDDLNNTNTASDSGISNLITETEIIDNIGSNNRLIGLNGTQITPPDEFGANEVNTEKDFNVDIAEKRTADVKSVPIEYSSNDNSYRSESPPSLVLSNDSYADDFNIESNVCDSLPSLKLDSIDEDLPEFSSSSGENEIRKSNDFESPEVCNVVPDDDRIEVHVQEIAALTLRVPQEPVLKEPTAHDDQPPKVDSSTFDLDESFDDFIEYTETEIPTKRTPETSEIDAAPNIPNSFDDENNFAADFSQFSEFSVSEPAAITVTSQTADFDENTFGDFAENVPATSVDSQSVDVQKEMCEDHDDFDDFGDFSDFSQSQPTISIIKSATENICPNIPLVLDMMFPTSPSENIQHSVSDDIKPNLDTNDMLNKTTTDLKNFDNSKALDHQWLQSIGKNSLVTALGIDSRNIVCSTRLYPIQFY